MRPDFTSAGFHSEHRSFARAARAAYRCLALLGVQSVDSLSSRDDLPIVRGACRASVALSVNDRAACVRRLRPGMDSARLQALVVALRGDLEPDALSPTELLARVESPEAEAPVFARALGARDSELLRPRIRQLLGSGNAVLRSQLALGLARSPDRSAVSLLVEAFAFETEETVRRAIVRALSVHPEPQRTALLQSALRLDPDRQVRELARQALSGARLDQPRSGSQAAWMQLSGPQASQPRGPNGRSLLLVPADGLAVLAVTDDDGGLLLAGLPPGEVRVVLAPSSQTGQASAP